MPFPTHVAQRDCDTHTLAFETALLDLLFRFGAYLELLVKNVIYDFYV